MSALFCKQDFAYSPPGGSVSSTGLVTFISSVTDLSESSKHRPVAYTHA